MNDLTQREREIARLVAEGLTAGEIATRLGLRPQTVKNSKSIIYSKMAVKNAVQLTRALVERGTLCPCIATFAPSGASTSDSAPCTRGGSDGPQRMDRAAGPDRLCHPGSGAHLPRPRPVRGAGMSNATAERLLADLEGDSMIETAKEVRAALAAERRATVEHLRLAILDRVDEAQQADLVAPLHEAFAILDAEAAR